MAERNRLEPLPDGFVAFWTKDGQRWKHKDMAEGRVGDGYRVFISDAGEERRYAFGPKEPHDATLEDLRDQLARAHPVAERRDSESSESELPYPLA